MLLILYKNFLSFLRLLKATILSVAGIKYKTNGYSKDI